MDIIIDTRGESSLLSRDRLIDSDDDVDFDETTLNVTGISYYKRSNGNEKKRKVKENDIDLDEFEAAMGWNEDNNSKKSKKFDQDILNVDQISKEVNPLDELLSKSAIKPGFEQLESVPRYDVSRRIHQKIARKEREKTKGKKWFNLPATEMTPEIKHDLQIIQMRSVLDPKHFYKKNDIKALPKYFQVGKVMDTPTEYYSGRLTNKERKKTLVDELIADAEFAKYNKKKYKEIINSNRKTHSKAHQHSRKLKKKK
ncbi:deoxynucleotidyltransferase terminal-interacting protein 2 [Chelonus insularis]|uniref:deoxynucleotidyltransferase terminal-interacting protein 2 n=1 Tax=Chelonus insularis TaxID=460826 RepID=UPI00158C56D0|nr:deoxynucleotidyltransferase terminal-interacting protein 2 [Chelonus insularis]